MTKRKPSRAAAPSAPAAPDPTHIRDLVADPNNRRKRTARSLGLIVDALHQVGAARSIVIDEDNEILAGNGVVEGAADAGITKVRVVEASGDEVIAVRRRGLTAEQKRKLSMFDNRAAELAEWDTDQIEADVAAGADLTPFFTDEELRKLLHTVAPGGAADADQEVPGNFLVVITCTDEQQQVDLLGRFVIEGLQCKALVS